MRLGNLNGILLLLLIVIEYSHRYDEDLDILFIVAHLHLFYYTSIDFTLCLDTHGTSASW